MTSERRLQTRLVAHGARICVDGDIGRATIAALKAFQDKRGLRVTGIANAATVKAQRQPAKVTASVPGEVRPNRLLRRPSRRGCTR